MQFINNTEKFKRRQTSEVALNMILEGKFPEKELKELYDGAYNEIAKIVSDTIDSEGLGELKPIETVPLESNRIYQLKQQADSDALFNKMIVSLRKWETPDRKILREIAGDNAVYVEKNLKAFNDLKLTRTCDVPYNLHNARSGAIARYIALSMLPKLGLKDRVKENEYVQRQVVKWMLHDSEEEIWPRMKRGSKLVYEFDELDKFNKDFIPEEIQEDINFLSNKPKRILNYLENKVRNVENLDYKLGKLLGKNHFKTLEESIHNLKEFISHRMNKYHGNPDFMKEIYSEQYKELFLEELMLKPKLFIEKGKVDLLDNMVAWRAPDLNFQIRLIRKAMDYVDTAEKLPDGTEGKAEMIKEIIQISNYIAKDIMTGYMADNVAYTSSVSSAMGSLAKMKPALYENSISPSK